jgi:hypothetical protein
MWEGRYRQKKTLPLPLSPIGRYVYTNTKDPSKKVESIVQSSHPAAEELQCWDIVHEGPPYRDAGTFFKLKYERPSLVLGGTTLQCGSYILGSSNSPFGAGTVPWSAVYEGGFASPFTAGYDDAYYAALQGTSPTDFSSIHPDDLSSSGARAYNLMRPKPETLDIPRSLVELKDLPRMLQARGKDFDSAYRALTRNNPRRQRDAIRSASRMPKGLADRFLEYQFGWRPFVNDLSGLFGLVDRVGRHVAMRKRYNDRWVKRRRTEPIQQSVEVVYSSSGSSLSCTPALAASGQFNYLMPGSARYRIVQEKTTSVWFTGLFKQYRIEFDPEYEKAHPRTAQARQVLTSLGYYVNPMVVYKLTPWSWLADWTSSVGDNLQAYQDYIDETVVSKHICGMRHKTSQLKYQQYARCRDGSSLSFEFVRGFESKYRIPSLNPYSFSLTSPSNLSGVQQLILGALGISKFT